MALTPAFCRLVAASPRLGGTEKQAAGFREARGTRPGTVGLKVDGVTVRPLDVTGSSAALWTALLIYGQHDQGGYVGVGGDCVCAGVAVDG